VKNLLKITIAALLALACQSRTARAQEADAFKLKHLSSFSQTSAHNPFWPIGWVKGPESRQSVQEVAVPITPENFSVTSISISPTPLAIINNKSCAEGETITANYGGQSLKILVRAIHDGEVILQYEGKNYSVPLRRTELAPKENVSEPVTSQEGPMILH